jgi:5-methylcytosine-specific restriction endonuclease McrA
MVKRSMTRAERSALYARTQGTCEWCGRHMDYDDMADHHRKLRSQGGGWELSNQLGVHHRCHNVQPGSIHQEVHMAKARGAIVSSWQDPWRVPVNTPGGIYLLTDDGGKEPYVYETEY